MPSALARLAVLVNLVPPYRVCLLESLAEKFQVRVMYSGHEPNRSTWQANPSREGRVEYHQSAGWVLNRKVAGSAGVYRHRFLHFTPGYWKDLKTFNPDVILSAEMGFRTLLALRYAKRRRTPVMIWWEGTPHTERSTGPSRRTVRRFIARRATGWIVSGGGSAEYIRGLGVRTERIVETQISIDESAFRSATPSHQLLPRPALLFVGELIELKGLQHLLRVAASLQAEGHEFSLTVVGDGPQRAFFEQLGNTLGIKHLDFLGALKPEALPGVYRSADCLVFPTLGDVWGVVVNEALWSGISVLASVYAGAAEVLDPSCRFDPLDEESFRSTLRRFLANRTTPPANRPLRSCLELAEEAAQALQALVVA